MTEERVYSDKELKKKREEMGKQFRELLAPRQVITQLSAN
jgi:hypothetical protein